MSKFLITTGWNQNGYPRDSEILDLSIKGGSNCNDWPEFPKDVNAATGGVIQDVVVICGGGDASTEFNECYSLNGNAATLITHMSAKRQYAASLVIDKTKLWITGGVYLDFNLASSEYITLEGTEPGPELPTTIDSHALGAKYLVFVSSRSVKMRELSFAHFVYFLGKMCLFLNDKIHNYVKQNIIVNF